jgi:hypothetical protein
VYQNLQLHRKQAEKTTFLLSAALQMHDPAGHKDDRLAMTLVGV